VLSDSVKKLLRARGEFATFDRMDILEAYFLYACWWGWDDYTHGINSRVRRVAKLSQNIGCSDRRWYGMNNSNALAIYLNLVRRREGHKKYCQEKAQYVVACIKRVHPLPKAA
jgi:hypothetical protein